MCLFAIKTQLTRGNNAECVKALRGERRTKPIFVSQLALPPNWAAPLCATSHRKTFPLCIQQATLMCKCMQENFRKAKITEPNEVAGLKLSGLWIITAFYGTFLNFLWNNDFSGLIEKKNQKWCEVIVSIDFMMELPYSSFFYLESGGIYTVCSCNLSPSFSCNTCQLLLFWHNTHNNESFHWSAQFFSQCTVSS